MHRFRFLSNPGRVPVRPRRDLIHSAYSAAMGYRVVQWSTGNVGRHALRCIIGHPDLELVGLWVHSDDKVGQ